MDAACGAILDALDRLGLRDDTLVFFTSDNGPAVTGRHPHGSAGPLRDKKGSLYEGGIRVPGILRWPGRTPPGGVSPEPVSGVDVLPTFCRIAGVPVPGRRPLDGASFLPAVRGEPIERATPLYWHFYRARGGPKVAMRVGAWKLLAGFDVADVPPGADLTAAENRALKSAGLTNFELYNLGADAGERKNLAASRPGKLAALRARLEPKYLEVREESPLWPEWKWPRYEAQRIEWPDYKGHPLER
jgi:arylsulfatase A